MPKRDTFRYLRSMLQSNDDIDKDVCHKIEVGWMKWQQVSGILCEKKVPQNIKFKYYREAIRSLMLYDAQWCPTKRQHIQHMRIVEMCML